MTASIHGSQAPLSEQELAAAERQLGVRFPEDYRSFMLCHNGGRPKPDSFAIAWAEGQAAGEDWKTSCFGWFYFLWERDVANLLESNLVSFRGRLPPDTIAIGHDAGGNQILLALAGPYQGKVLFWCRDYEDQEAKAPGYDNVGVIADSFDDFLANKLR